MRADTEEAAGLAHEVVGSAIGTFRTEFRLGRHLLIPAAATVVFGVVTAGILRARRPTAFQAWEGPSHRTRISS